MENCTMYIYLCSDMTIYMYGSWHGLPCLEVTERKKNVWNVQFGYVDQGLWVFSPILLGISIIISGYIKVNLAFSSPLKPKHVRPKKRRLKLLLGLQGLKLKKIKSQICD